jgi:hypothetical protein
MMKNSNNENGNSQLPQGAYLASEEVALFDHALDKLEKARHILQMVASGMKPADATI